MSDSQPTDPLPTVAQQPLPPLQVDSPTILPWYPAFLRALALRGTVAAACMAAHITRTHAYRCRKEDEAFARVWDEALEVHADLLEMEADRRSMEGVPRKKFTTRGEPIIDPETKKQYIEREYSDTLLLARLRAERPEKYRVQQPAATGPSAQVQINLADPALQALVSAVRAKVFAPAPAEQLPGPEVLQPPQPDTEGIS
jgi:hypothetical protein